MSLWRVLLMVRVVTVLVRFGPLTAFFQVALFADVAALIAVAFLPVPIIQIMGGIRLSPEDQVLSTAGLIVALYGSASLLVLVPGAFLGRLRGAALDLPWGRPAALAPAARAPATRPMKLLAFSSLAVWALVLPLTQPEQALRRRIEKDIQAGGTAEALAEMSAHRPEDFPPHWRPPPRPWRWGGHPPILDILEGILLANPPPWVRSAYLEKLEKFLVIDWLHNEPEQERLISLVSRIPEGPDLRKRFPRAFEEQPPQE